MTPREYADFFEFPDRDRKELGIVEELIRSLKASGRPEFSTPANHRPDPPDCVARNVTGALVAFEVTELVSQAAVELDAQGDKVLALWEAGDLTATIRDRLTIKDGKRFHGGPYSEIVVVLYTDEFYLNFESAEAELAHASFGPFEQLSNAYLLFSYSPAIQRYPVVRLSLESPGTSGRR